ncbi:transposase protein A [Azorhizobium caulinodans ORS 571]|uniref:Transposase protein A n=1 Tax=Azorhizobium caulinodans (strain ATCC 43989 / DSM 5975 / JCM 20966 / LMG 6465 / NBRC 14845 / NCIMB 13405 / ORS 571) TaxID=438753 RepID=A8I7J2_AZOC5|nr:DDE-type integrase/transposase/recombinase [Azorhizobium caulinodans]BAF88126.1 transposase protein A [Azorhizobium caulinodans ORS 571]
MKSWFTAAEIAGLGLPDIPESERGVRKMAGRDAWPSREREASGGGREYPLSALPTAARAAYVARHLQALDVPVEVVRAAASEPEAELAAPAALDQRDGRLAILAAVEDFAASAGIGRKRADTLFCAAYEAGAVEVAAWVRAAVRSVTPRTLARWRAAQAAGATHRLAVDKGAARRGKGVLEVANAGDVKVFCLALLSRNPLFTADHVRDLVGGQFGPTLEVRGKVLPLPPLRTFQEALKGWKTTHKVELTALTNPDAFKNRYRLSGRGAMAHVQAPNQLWMIDASPVDMLCLDGRHNVYVAIDIFTRRIIAYVTKTPRAEGVSLLMRRAILAWGVPEEVKTDNGADFVAHATRRLFAAIGIRRVTAEAFSPEQKGHVERAIGTFQRGFVRLLPGFIGHSVADRKVIEARKSFAARLGEDPREALCVELSAAELQRYADAWIASKYDHRPHEGLGGVTPFQAAAASTAPIRTVEERALDMLLAPVAGQHGLRTATKSGIRIDGFHYLAPQVLPETQVMVRMDPADMGRAFLFDPAGITYLGEAICPELAGIDPKLAVEAAKAEQARIIAERTASVRKEARRLTKGPRLIDLALRHTARQAGTLVDFPKAREAHTTPALEAAAEAATPRSAPAPRLSDETRALRARLAAEAAPEGAQVRPLHATETPKQRWNRAQALERRLAAGEALAPEETTWLLGYAQGPEYKGFKLTFGDSHDVAPRQAPVEAG